MNYRRVSFVIGTKNDWAHNQIIFHVIYVMLCMKEVGNNQILFPNLTFFSFSTSLGAFFSSNTAIICKRDAD